MPPQVLLPAILTGLPLLLVLWLVHDRWITAPVLRFLYGTTLVIAALAFGFSYPFVQDVSGGVRMGVLAALYGVGLWSLRAKGTPGRNK